MLGFFRSIGTKIRRASGYVFHSGNRHSGKVAIAFAAGALASFFFGWAMPLTTILGGISLLSLGGWINKRFISGPRDAQRDAENRRLEQERDRYQTDYLEAVQELQQTLQENQALQRTLEEQLQQDGVNERERQGLQNDLNEAREQQQVLMKANDALRVQMHAAAPLPQNHHQAPGVRHHRVNVPVYG